MVATIINSLIALTLGTYAVKYRNSVYVVFILFVYISLHYAYSAVAIFGGSEYLYIRSSTQLGAKIIGAGFLLFTMGLMIYSGRSTLWPAIQAEPIRGICFATIVWLFVVGGVWVLQISNGTYPSPLALQDIVSTLMMLGMAMIIAAVLPHLYRENSFSWKTVLRLLLCLIIIMDVISLYQVATGNIFSGHFNLTGEYAFRACGLLLNPNLYGLWCVLVASVAAYVFHIGIGSKLIVSMVIGIATLGLFLSGSRSALLIGLFMFGLVAMLQVKFGRNRNIRRCFYPFFIYLISFIGIAALSKALNALSKASFNWLHLLSMLADRFAEMFGIISAYVLYKFWSYTSSVLMWLHEFTGSEIFLRYQSGFAEKAVKIHTSSTFDTIDGRVNSATPLVDNGYIAMLHDTNWAGLLAWFILWSLVVWMGVKNLRSKPSLHHIYALSAICTALFSALMNRSFQVFPIWVLVGIILGISLVVFKTGKPRKDIYENS